MSGGGTSWREAGKDLFSGTVAGMVAKVFEYPFDTVKVRQQTQPGLGVVECVTRSVRSGGVLSLYRGMSAPLFGAMAENALVFSSYAGARRALAGTSDYASGTPAWHALAAGAASGFVVAFWLTPVELVKVRLQAEGKLAYRGGPIECVRSLYREGGLGFFFRGHTATLLRETAGGAFYFGGYALASRALTPQGAESAPAAATMLAGGLGGTCYWLSTFPADTVKSRMQSGQVPAAHSFSRALAEVHRAEGVAGLYRGVGVTVARAFPSNAIIFLVYETVMKWCS